MNNTQSQHAQDCVLVLKYMVLTGPIVGLALWVMDKAGMIL